LCLTAFVVALAVSPTGRAAEEGASGQKPNEPKQEKRREEFKNLSPEERRTKWREEREKREAWTPEQREAKRKELRERFEKRLADLKKKKTDGTLTEQEAKQLEQMEQMKKRLQQFGRGGAPPPKRPNGDQPPAPQKPPAAK
jgi:hypothetical protein